MMLVKRSKRLVGLNNKLTVRGLMLDLFNSFYEVLILGLRNPH